MTKRESAIQAERMLHAQRMRDLRGRRAKQNENGKNGKNDTSHVGIPKG